VIKSTGGKSTGVIPWMRIYNDTLVGVDQGGRRKGAGVAYLEPWHLDFEAFLDLRKNTGDEHLRCHDMHTSGWVPDLFMKRVEADEDWTMFDPSETPELANSWGDGFNCHYENFEADAQAGRIKNFKTIKAKDLWRKWLSSLFETGHPWVSFKDVSNERYSNQHEGMVRSSNLCVEICLHTHATVYDGQDLIKLGETAVCNLASLNIPEHINENGEIEFEKLRNTIAIAINALDAVIDINFYPTKEAENSNLKHRPVGLGIMGLQAALQKLGVVFDSEEAVEFSDRLMEFISYWAIHYSSKLAEEKGTYSTYKGSLWDQGLFPIDTYSHRVEDCSEAFYNFEFVNEWYKLREQVNEHGVRNSNMLAIAPTATIAHIQGVSNGIDPDKSVLWTLENLSGTFTIINEQFVYDMEARGLWDESLIEELKAVDGDVSKLSSVPDDLKALYKTCFDCDQHRLIDCAAERQKWIDQSQSLNLFYAGDSRKELSDIYFHAWKSGLKTTYYLRTVGASQTEKVSSQKACSITNPDCESCQ
jgi:ribonucleoside-diphosphate reductase alpha chain